MKAFQRSFAVLAAVALAASPVQGQSYAGGPQPTMGGFGGAVAIAGDQVLIGEPDNIGRPGMVYIYDRLGGEWGEAGTLMAPEAERGDGFGASIAVDGTTLLVGGQGVAYLFERSADGEWTPVGSLSSSMSTEDDGFGSAVGLWDDIALVGAPARGMNGEGAVVVFSRSEEGWREVETLTLEGAGEGAAFGSAMAMSGDIAMIGAPGANPVSAYRLDTMGSESVGEIAPNFGGPGGQIPEIGFGSAVAFDGSRVAVGAPQAGVAFIFDDEEGEWVISGQLRSFAGQGRGFAAGLVLNGPEVWAAAPGDGAYIFTQDETGAWTNARRIIPEAGGASTVAVSGEVAVLGLPGVDRGLGRASILLPEGDDWVVASGVMSEADGFDPVRGGQIDCSEGQAVAWECSEVDLVGFMPARDMGADRGVGMNDVWGWTDPETGKEWALAGMQSQTAFIDVSDPENPVYVGRLPLTPGANPAAWRDIKTYDDHAFIVADGAGQHGMQVFDLTRLRDFDGTPEMYEPDALYTNVASVHNIVINTDAGMAFAVGSRGGGESCGGGLHMIDIRDPKNPTFAGCFADPQTGRASTGYSHDAQCVTYDGPDAEYQGREICLGSNETALSIADVTDKANPVAVSRATYPNYGYSHQGWLDEEHRYFYMNDELDEIQGKVDRTRTLVWDVSDLDDPQLILEHLGNSPSSDHNLYIVGDLMYQSNYKSGLRVLDISDRENPVEIGYFDTVPYGDNSPGTSGSWSNYPFFESGMILVTSGFEGLFILKPRRNPTIS